MGDKADGYGDGSRSRLMVRRADEDQVEMIKSEADKPEGER